MNKKIVIGNWKMNPVFSKDAEKLFVDISKSISSIKKTEIVICPPFLYLDRLKKISRKIFLGAQDASYEDNGAFTGEMSPLMLYNAGVKYVILGHSERRALGESNILVNKKIKACLQAGLRPIVCVGENTRDESHSYFNLVKAQIEECLVGISKNLISKIVIAYEPIWAISSSRNREDANPSDSLEMSIFIRKIISDKFGSEGKKTRIIYGGSVNEKNTLQFLQDGGVDGLLVGQASLNANKFSEIVKICEALGK